MKSCGSNDHSSFADYTILRLFLMSVIPEALPHLIHQDYGTSNNYTWDVICKSGHISQHISPTENYSARHTHTHISL